MTLESCFGRGNGNATGCSEKCCVAMHETEERMEACLSRGSAGNTTSKYDQVSPMSISGEDIPMFQ